VMGVDADRAEKVMREVYEEILEDGTPLIVTDFATAELVKVAANAFLATKISFINAMAEVCERTGADVTELAQALSHDERIGGKFLHAGLGFGGGCLPKDIRAFMARAEELGVDQAVMFLKEIDAINLRRRARMVDLARELCDGSLAGMRVGVLGAAFKPNSDDIRDSPALDVSVAVQRAGAAVRVYDPQAMENARRDFPTLAYADSAVDACGDADVVLHLTEWSEFRTMHPSWLTDVVRQRNIVDGRNALDRDLWRAEGWVYRALGRQ
jgi:UDPglucose 6-dehydrogenase